MQQTLTDRQREVLEEVRDYINTHDQPPATRDIANRCGVAQSTALQHLQALERKGAITREPRKHRSIQITEAYR